MRWKLAGLLVILLLAGCAPTSETGERVGREASITPIAPTPAIFRENELELSPATRDWVQRMHRTPGTHLRREGGYRHVLVALGQRPTGGFRVDLEAIVEHPDYILLQAVEIAPAPGDMVIQVLTYPYLFLSVETDKEVRASVLPVESPGAEPGQKR
jgi:hypothetical protein